MVREDIIEKTLLILFVFVSGRVGGVVKVEVP